MIVIKSLCFNSIFAENTDKVISEILKMNEFFFWRNFWRPVNSLPFKEFYQKKNI